MSGRELLPLLFGCLPLLAGCATVPVAEPLAAPGPAPTWQEAANASYAGALRAPVTLVDGVWQGAPYAEGGASAPRAGLVRDFLLSGDLDGDGAEESAVLLWTSSGGSGTFDYLVVLDREANGAAGARAAAPLGDRVGIRAASIEDGRVVLDTVQAGPSDAACCPGQKMRRTYALAGDVMAEFSTEDQGRLSLADLRGAWVLTHFAHDEKVPDGVAITLQLDGDRLAGQAPCNEYSGVLQAGSAPGDVALAGPLAVTRVMCPPPLTDSGQRYLLALQGLVKYSFMAGKLALTWSDAEGIGTLLFTPAD